MNKYRVFTVDNSGMVKIYIIAALSWTDLVSRMFYEIPSGATFKIEVYSGDTIGS